MSEPLRFKSEVIAENVGQYPDMRLRMIIRQAVTDATEHDVLTLDEAVEILDKESRHD